MTEYPDRRLNAFRPDLAEVGLKGRVEAERFVEGESARVVEPVVSPEEFAVQHESRHTEVIFDFTDNVQIRHTRFHNHHVSPFLNIEGNFM